MQRRINTKAVQPRARADPNSHAKADASGSTLGDIP